MSLFAGLSYKKLNRLDEALDSFLKLHAILRNSAQVLFQIASMYLFHKSNVQCPMEFNWSTAGAQLNLARYRESPHKIFLN